MPTAGRGAGRQEVIELVNRVAVGAGDKVAVHVNYHLDEAKPKVAGASPARLNPRMIALQRGVSCDYDQRRRAVPPPPWV